MPAGSWWLYWLEIKYTQELFCKFVIPLKKACTVMMFLERLFILLYNTIKLSYESTNKHGLKSLVRASALLILGTCQKFAGREGEVENRGGSQFFEPFKREGYEKKCQEKREGTKNN